MQHWSVEEVCRWLLGLGEGFRDFCRVVRTNGLDGRVLMDATLPDLIETGLLSLQAKRLLQVSAASGRREASCAGRSL